MTDDFTQESLQALADEHRGCAFIPHPNLEIPQAPKGGKLEFLNGYALSIVYGGMAYGDGRVTAEIAAMDPSGEFVRLEGHDDVAGWQTYDEVADWAAEIASW